jgi:hypothetical protein
MGEQAPFSVGDWLRFWRGDSLRIGQVEYVQRAERWPNRWQAVTDVGTVDADSVLERRARTPAAEVNATHNGGTHAS